MLIQEFNCVEAVPDPPADAAAGDDAGERDGDGIWPAMPLPLPPFNKLASQPASEGEDASQLPQQRRVGLLVPAVRSLFSPNIHARDEIPNEVGPICCRATPDLHKSADETQEEEGDESHDSNRSRQ
jgi:hypothetical protein